MLPFLVVFAIGLYLLHTLSKGVRRDAVLWLAILGMASLIVFMPLLRYSLDNPDAFSYRAFTRMGSIERPLPGPALEIFFSNLWNALRMFNWDNGEVWVHSVTHRPALDVVSGALFLIGVLLVIVRYLRQHHWLDLLLLLSIPILQLPRFYPWHIRARIRLSIVLAVHTYRLLYSLHWLWIVDWQIGIRKGPYGVCLGAGIFLLSLSGFQNYDLVFRQYSGLSWGAWNSSELGAVIEEFRDMYGTTDTVWIVPFPHWVDTRLPGVWAGIPNRDFAAWREHLGDTMFEGPKLFIVKAKLNVPDDNDQETLDVLSDFTHRVCWNSADSDVEGQEFWISLFRKLFVILSPQPPPCQKAGTISEGGTLRFAQGEQ